MFFNTSNDLYDLGLELKPLPTTPLPTRGLSAPQSDAQLFTKFMAENPTVKLIRLQWVDYTGTSRLRVIPVREVKSLLQKDGILKTSTIPALLGILQQDWLIPGMEPNGEIKLHGIMSTLRSGPCRSYAFMQGEFYEPDGSEVALDPRTALRTIVSCGKSQGLEFLLGFEIEIVFMRRNPTDNSLSPLLDVGGHAYASPRAMHGTIILGLLEHIFDTLEAAEIHLQQWHPEAAPGQYEFVLPPLPPVEAVDMMIQAREIIMNVAAQHNLRATMYPKPFPMAPGSASHAHMSISSPGGDEKTLYESFWAGVLKHYRAIIAFTYSNPASYDRMIDSCWAGGRWVCWGR